MNSALTAGQKEADLRRNNRAKPYGSTRYRMAQKKKQKQKKKQNKSERVKWKLSFPPPRLEKKKFLFLHKGGL